MTPFWRRGVVLGAAVLMTTVFVALSCTGGGEPRVRPGGASSYPLQTFADQGREHLPSGQTNNNYNSNPPTSGSHAPRPADWGVHNVPVPKEAIVHNMEHGGAAIWYNCAGGPSPLDAAGCQQLAASLAQIARQSLDQGRLVVMTPYAGMSQRIALTAWQTLDAFDDFDSVRVVDFIARYERLFNPEGF